MAGKRIFVFAAFALVALALALSARGGAEAQTFKPHNGYILSSHTPSDSTGTLSTLFSIPAPDYNYEDSSMTTLNPPDAWAATGLEAPIGAKAGQLDSSAMIGLLGGTCNTALVPHFDLYNSSVDISVEDPSSNLGWILQPVSATIPDTGGIVGVPDYMEKYPYFLNKLFDPDGTGPLLPLQPRARLSGTGNAANKHVLINVLIWDASKLAAAGGIYAQFNEAKGGATGSVLNNPVGEGASTPGAIGDFCTPLSTTTLLYGVTQAGLGGAAGGNTRQRNPAADTGVLLTQTHLSYNYSQSERNADGDAFETDFDACKFTADPVTQRPRDLLCTPGSDPGDMDCDMLGVSCDPNDLVANPDIDNDAYSNTQDVCPFVPNGCNNAACGVPFNPAWDNQDDEDQGMLNADLGPKADALGDACDDTDDDGNEDLAGPGTCNDGIDNPGGDLLIDGLDPDCVPSMDAVDWPPVPVTQPQNGTYFHGYPWEAECVGGADVDLDGYCDVTEVSLGSRPNNGPETVCTGTGAGADDDLDGYANDGCAFVGYYAESGAECLNTSDDDPEAPPDGVANDGCPTIGVPENLVIDSNITANLALPTATAAQSCTDGVDNDDDGTTDAGDLECQPAAVTGDTDNDGFSDNPVTIGFGAQITGDHAGFETYTSDSTMLAFSWSYVPSTGVIKIGNGADFQCWIVRPADEDWLGPGAWDPNDLEVQVHCKGTPIGYNFQRVDLDGDGDQDIYWHKVRSDPRDPTGADNCPSVWNPTQTNTDESFLAKPAAGFPAGDALGDVCDTDDDADGYIDTRENYYPTDPQDRCREINNPGNNRSDAWALDINRDGVVTVADVLNFTGKIGQSVITSPPTSWERSRLDFNADKVITVADVLNFTGKIGQNCS